MHPLPPPKSLRKSPSARPPVLTAEATSTSVDYSFPFIWPQLSSPRTCPLAPPPPPPRRRRRAAVATASFSSSSSSGSSLSASPTLALSMFNKATSLPAAVAQDRARRMLASQEHAQRTDDAARQSHNNDDNGDNDDGSKCIKSEALEQASNAKKCDEDGGSKASASPSSNTSPKAPPSTPSAAHSLHHAPPPRALINTNNDNTATIRNNPSFADGIPTLATHSVSVGGGPTNAVRLMPAIVGTTELCSADFWSHDPGFMMYCYKITPCTYVTPHDWRACPWAHPNERAMRRDPRIMLYTSIPCASARNGNHCRRGAACEYSHNVTEYWLHPDRFRTDWCSLGDRCNRRLCFFAHSVAELRVAYTMPAAASASPGAQPATAAVASSAATASAARRQHSLDNDNNNNTAFDARVLQLLAEAVVSNSGGAAGTLMAAAPAPPRATATSTTTTMTPPAAPLWHMVHPSMPQGHQQQQHPQVPLPACFNMLNTSASIVPACPRADRRALPHTNTAVATQQLGRPPAIIDQTTAAQLMLALLQNMPQT